MAKDFIFDDNNDLEILDGDFKTAESDQQEVEDILIARPGQVYQSPKIGIDINQYKNGSIDPQQLEQRIKLGLTADGFTVTQVEVNDKFEITIDAERKKQ